MAQSTLRWGGGLNLGLVVERWLGVTRSSDPPVRFGGKHFRADFVFVGTNPQWERLATLRQTDHPTCFGQGHTGLFARV